MTKSYKFKVFANSNKTKELDRVMLFWRDQVNHKIDIFWDLKEFKGSYPPKEYTSGGRLVSDSSKKAWYLVKKAKKSGQNKPSFKGFDIDLNQFSACIISDFRTEEFDVWFSVISLNKGQRLKIPCKKTGIFNKAVEKGQLRKSFKLLKINNNYYMQCYVEFKEKEQLAPNHIGIDVGIDNAVATSDGKLLGIELKALRIRTRWRKYKTRLTPNKQGLNHYAKELVKMYPETNFVVENLLFRGKGKRRSKLFRKRHNCWAYNHLSNKLSELGHLEGFQVIKVNPAYSSQQCPACGFTNQANRQYGKFLCGLCGYENHADVVGAINIAGRVAKEPCVPLTRQGV